MNALACRVTMRAESARYTDTATSPSLGRSIVTGSLIATAPGRSVIALLPPNVSARSVFATIAAPLSRTAMCADPITSGRSPYSLETRMRAWSPPIDVRTMSRSVCDTNVGVRSIESRGGRTAPAAGLVAQVANQREEATGAGDDVGCFEHAARTRVVTTRTRRNMGGCLAGE